MNIDIPGTDMKKALDFYSGNPGFYLKVLRSYVSHIPPILDKIRKVSDETLGDYLAAIHIVKGSSATIGAEEVEKAAINLEKMGKKGDIAGVKAENDAFLKLADTLVDNIRTWLKQNDVQ